MPIKNKLRLSGSIVLACSLAACGGGGNRSAAPSPTPTPIATATPGSFQSMFGASFAAIFDASPTSQPVDPTDASVPPLAPASQPLDN
jgi:hypothetical protein